LQQGLSENRRHLIKHARYCWLLLAESNLTRRLFGGMLRRIAALPSTAGWASRRPKQISVLAETGEGKVFEEWVGEASVFGFDILPQPSERLYTQKPGWGIAY
jgi:hypothetical protein